MGDGGLIVNIKFGLGEKILAPEPRRPKGDLPWWLVVLIIAGVVMVYVNTLGCASDRRKRLKEMYPDCQVNEEAELICPSPFKEDSSAGFGVETKTVKPKKK